MAKRVRRGEPLLLVIVIAAAMFAMIGFAFARGHSDWTEVLISSGYAAVASIAVASIGRRLREQGRAGSAGTTATSEQD